MLPPEIIEQLAYKSGRIYRVGVEMEGGWHERPDGDLHGDGSVSIDDYNCHYIGEVVSEPMAPVDLPEWMSERYPDVTNSSCGLHLHMSFRSGLTYQRLMCKDYFEFLLTTLHTWGKETRKLSSSNVLFTRLRGDNQYCRRVYAADEQAAQRYKEGVRYSAVNYCWALHKTIEVRVLPMFSNEDLGIDAVVQTMLATNHFLTTAPPEEPVVGAIEDEDGLDLSLTEEIY